MTSLVSSTLRGEMWAVPTKYTPLPAYFSMGSHVRKDSGSIASDTASIATGANLDILSKFAPVTI